MNEEVLLITAVVEGRDLLAARREGLLPQHFGEPRTKAAYEYLLKYADEHHGSIPTKEMFVRRSGYTEWVDVPESLDASALAREIVQLSLARQIEQAIPDIAELRQKPKEVGRAMQEKLRTILVEHGDKTVIPFKVSLKELTMQIASGAPIVRGLPYPWKSLEEASLGMMAKEVIVLYGRPGSFKTWLLLKLAAYLFKFRTELTIMIGSCELPHEMITRRLLALLAGIPYDRLRKNELTEDERQAIEMWSDLVEHHSVETANLVIATREANDLDDFRRRVDAVQPDILFVDSVYYLVANQIEGQSAERRNMVKVMETMRTIADQHKIPVILTYQAKRQKSEAIGFGGGDDLYGSDAPAQAGDVLYRLYRVADEDGREHALVQIAKSREFQIGGVLLSNPPDTGDCVELSVYNTATAVEIELLKIQQRAKQANKKIVNLEGFGRRQEEK